MGELGGQIKILGGAKVVKSDKCMGVSQLLGARARAAPLSLRLCLPSSIRFYKKPIEMHKNQWKSRNPPHRSLTPIVCGIVLDGKGAK